VRKGKKSPDSMSFLEHLDDLRKRILYSAIAVIVAAIPAWFFHEEIFDILARPVRQYLPEGEDLAVTTLPEAFMVYLKVSILTAIIVTSPFIFYQLWKFVAPGLYQKEKKYVTPFIFFTTIFFCSGVLFGYYIAFPFACSFFLKFSADFKSVIKVDNYFSLAFMSILGIALVFELPTLAFFLSQMGLITSRWMIKNFKYAVLVIFIIAAIITPSADQLNQCILGFPMLALYGLSILIVSIVEKKAKAGSIEPLASVS